MRLLSLSMIAALAISHTATAATSATPFMVNAPGSRLHCDVVNVSSSTINVKIELVGGNGSVVATRSGSLRPGAAGSEIGQCPLSAGGTPPGCGGYCRFTAPRKNQIRGSLIITPGDSESPLVALPAQ
jgi:hypothetical protein